MKRERKKKIHYGRIVFLLLLIAAAVYGSGFLLKGFKKIGSKDYYVKSSSLTVPLYDDEFKEVTDLSRGTKLTIASKKVKNEEESYYRIKKGEEEYYIKTSDLTENKEEIVEEKEMFVRTPATIYKDLNSSKILSFGKKGEALEIVGFDEVSDTGAVKSYKVKKDDKEGYIYGKYLEFTKEKAEVNYDHNGSYEVHASREDYLRGGSAGNLDYFPVEKPKFENNVMPEEVKALYLNAGVLDSIDEYIALAKESGINAFVVDIKDDTEPGYESLVMKELSPTSYKYAINTMDEYRKVIQKIKDAGIYVIGRITTFKDSYYIADHPEDAILDNETGAPYEHDGSYWPSAFKRTIWEYDVELAKEAVKEMGFNEIQFDYVRFPDRTYYDEEDGIINFQNEYGEEKAQAIQNFLRYACDEIHKLGAYVSADVFGESAHNYVTGYGQYWGAISNVVDVISGMPYPELFNKYEYGFDDPVWTIPYDLLKLWSTSYVLKQQELVPTPAIVRTWIQAYDATWKYPEAIYDSDMVSDEIRGLYDSGIRNGFIAWNGGSSLSKYRALSDAFKKEY